MRGFLLVVTVLAACGDDAATPDAGLDAPPSCTEVPAADPTMPATLCESGLYSDWDSETLADGVHAFTPDPVLWSDGATKRRWIYLPEGATIDTSDMDYWQFPEGTKLWKEFTRDDVRVETRLLQKNGPDPEDWYMVAYAWNAAQTEAVATTLGAADALGTDHDIPSRSDCRKCHDRLPSRILGFSAISLDLAATGTEVALAEAIANGWLSDPPNGAAPYFPLPGAALDQEALGYLHVNCGNCHNAMTDISTVSVRFRLEVGGLASVAATTTGQTAFGVSPNLTVAGATSIIEPGDHAASAAWLRMSSTNAAIMMPPLGHELVDTAAAMTLSDWIDSL